MGLKEIEKLNMDEERLTESKARLGKLEGRIAINDKIANEKLTKERKKRTQEKKPLGKRISRDATAYGRVRRKSL